MRGWTSTLAVRACAWWSGQKKPRPFFPRQTSSSSSLSCRKGASSDCEHWGREAKNV